MGNIPTWRDTAAPDASAAMQGLNIAGNQITAAGTALNKGLGDWDIASKNQATDALARAAAGYDDPVKLKAAEADGSLYAKAGIDPNSGWITATGLNNVDNRAGTLINQATSQIANDQALKMNPLLLSKTKAETGLIGAQAGQAGAETNLINTQTDFNKASKESRLKQLAAQADLTSADAENKKAEGVSAADVVAGNQAFYRASQYKDYASAAAALANDKELGADKDYNYNNPDDPANKDLNGPHTNDDVKAAVDARLRTFYGIPSLSGPVANVGAGGSGTPVAGQGTGQGTGQGKGGQGTPSQAIPPPPMPGTTPQGSPAGSPASVAMAAAIPYPETRKYVSSVIKEGGDNSPDAVWGRMVKNKGAAEAGGKQFDKNGNTIMSPKGAAGVAQVTETTGPEAAALAGVPWDRDKWLNDPAYNEKIGRAYFDQQVRHFGGDTAKAAAAYNAGPGAVEGWDLQGPHQKMVGEAATLQQQIAARNQQNQSGGIQGQYAVTENNTTMSQPEAINKLIADAGGDLDGLPRAKIKAMFNDIHERAIANGHDVSEATAGALIAANSARHQNTVLGTLAGMTPFGGFSTVRDALSGNLDHMDVDNSTINTQLQQIAGGQYNNTDNQTNVNRAFADRLQTASNTSTQDYNNLQRALIEAHNGREDIAEQIPALREKYKTSFALSQSLLEQAKTKKQAVLGKGGEQKLDKNGNPMYEDLPNQFLPEYKPPQSRGKIGDSIDNIGKWVSNIAN